MDNGLNIKYWESEFIQYSFFQRNYSCNEEFPLDDQRMTYLVCPKYETTGFRGASGTLMVLFRHFCLGE